MDGQVEFYKKNLQYINTELVMDDLLKGDTDGVLNGNLKSLRTLIKAYYNKYIVENLFKYELLK